MFEMFESSKTKCAGKEEKEKSVEQEDTECKDEEEEEEKVVVIHLPSKLNPLPILVAQRPPLTEESPALGIILTQRLTLNIGREVVGKTLPLME